MIIVKNELVNSIKSSIDKRARTQKSLKKIGLLVKMPESNFSNGCVQQAIFLKQLLENIGYTAEYVSIENKYKQIHDIHDPVLFMDETSDLSEFQTFIFVSLNISSPDNDGIINNIKKHGIVSINMLCGNLFVLHQEEFVFGHHGIIEKFIHGFYDEYWILEMYSFMTEYIHLLTNKPTYLLPYVWNNTIINKYIENHKLNFELDYHEVNREKINILIFEPNMSIHKSALIPLLIAESYNKNFKDKLNKVYVFCGDEVIRKKNNAFIKSLSIYTDKKLESYGRIVMPSILSLIKNSNPYINVVVSHNILNSLNFLHLECLTIDIPIIHNCKPFEENKLYYDDYNTTYAVDLIETVRTNFFLNSKYRNAKYKIHKEFHPSNFERQQVYKSHIQRITGVEIDNEKKLGPAEHLINLYTKISKFVSSRNTETSLFYNGTGIVILIQSREQIPSLRRTIKSLNDVKNIYRVEVVYHSNEIQKDELECIPSGYTIDYLNISNEFDNLEDKPNMYMSCVFSTFTKGIYVECGSIFIENPKILIEKYINDEYNSICFYPSFTRIKHMSTLDQDVHYKLAKEITPFPISTTDFTSDDKIIFFNKEKESCNKVLATMCELYKVNKYMATNLNILSLVCELNFQNDKSKLDVKQHLLGEIDQRFKGCALYIENEVIFCYKNFSTNTQKVIIDIQKDEIDLSIQDGYFVFSGKVNGKKIPRDLFQYIMS
uniref:Uncharacterized protein n=1 Tax=viral metagenome TaxID=1070528 RepID=A0A6C0CRX9_9ZZZZ